MSRPCKQRKICKEPKCLMFGPKKQQNTEVIILTYDEYEVIRLIDYELLSQESCAKQMNVARTTIQAIYESARMKLADSLINGKCLKIEGGNFIFCQNSTTCIKKYCCIDSAEINKEEKINMRIAITYKDGQVFGHLGKTENFKFFDIENSKIVKTTLVENTGSGPIGISEFLKHNNVDVIICGGLGQPAITALEKANIKLCAGVEGDVDNIVNLFLNQELKFNNVASCHCHEHHEEKHECGCHEHEEKHECGCHEHEEKHECGCHKNKGEK